MKLGDLKNYIYCELVDLWTEWTDPPLTTELDLETEALAHVGINTKSRSIFNGQSTFLVSDPTTVVGAYLSFSLWLGNEWTLLETFSYT